MRWELLLLPLEPLWSAAVRARAEAYRRGLARAERLPVPVVSVGNLAFGGTGKTPTVVSLVRDLVRRGRRPGVLTRGYRRRGREPLVVTGPEPELTAERAGDEPIEISRQLPGVPVIVDADRCRGGLTAIGLGADTVVLDDGFQHQRLVRDLDLVLLDAGDPFAGGHLPPRGRLREPLSALGRASAVLVTKLEPADEEATLAGIARRVGEVAPGVPVLGARTRLRRLRTPDGPMTAAALAGRRVLAFAGLGRPQGFADLLAAAGAEVVSCRWFADHHRYRERELAKLLAAAAQEGLVAVTTAKDAVKLPADAPVWVAEIEVEPVDGDWQRLWDLCPVLAGGEP